MDLKIVQNEDIIDFVKFHPFKCTIIRTVESDPNGAFVNKKD